MTTTYGNAEYQERRERRIARFEELAAKAQRESDAGWERSRTMLDVIPMGQPILVGHHSEKRHRALLRRSDNACRRANDAGKKAAYYRARAAAAASNYAIYRDNPDAVALLKIKLAGLEKLQARMKAVNAAHKRYKRNPATLDTDTTLSPAERAAIRAYVPAYSWEPHPFPPYRLTNNNATIRNVKQRIAHLEHVAAAPEPIEERGNGVRYIARNPHNGRPELRFNAKPPRATIDRLKASGWILRRKDGEWFWMGGWGSAEKNDALARELMGKETVTA